MAWTFSDAVLRVHNEPLARILWEKKGDGGKNEGKRTIKSGNRPFRCEVIGWLWEMLGIWAQVSTTYKSVVDQGGSGCRGRCDCAPTHPSAHLHLGAPSPTVRPTLDYVLYICTLHSLANIILIRWRANKKNEYFQGSLQGKGDSWRWYESKIFLAFIFWVIVSEPLVYLWW